MKTFYVTVTSTVKVQLDEAAFTPEFMQEYREHFSPFFSLADHAEHIGQLAAREVCTFGHNRDEFVEGYGRIGPMGIFAWTDDVATEAEEIADPINLAGSGPVPIEPREG